MYRFNASEPDVANDPGSKVVLTPNVRMRCPISIFSRALKRFVTQDVMFYQWRATHPELTMCYITALVPPPERMGSKSYQASGDVSAIEIWNITSPTPRFGIIIMALSPRIDPPVGLADHLTGTRDVRSEPISWAPSTLPHQRIKMQTSARSCALQLPCSIAVGR